MVASVGVCIMVMETGNLNVDHFQHPVEILISSCTICKVCHPQPQPKKLTLPSDFTDARRRESEKSVENETLSKEEDCHSPTSKPPKADQPLKVMPAPPPKENAWVKRSSNPPARSPSTDPEQQSPTR